jgi:hypothetical protein
VPVNSPVGELAGNHTGALEFQVLQVNAHAEICLYCDQLSAAELALFEALVSVEPLSLFDTSPLLEPFPSVALLELRLSVT